MKEERKKKKAGVRAGIVIGIVFALVMVSTLGNFVVENDNERWAVVWKGNLVTAAEGDPGAGASGFLEIFFINHSAAPADAYDENASATLESWCTTGYGYANADAFNLEISNAVTLDIVVRVRYNKTHAWETDKFIGADCRVNITTSGGDIDISDATGTNVESRNDTVEEFIYINVYWNNGGAGYQLAPDGTCTISEISIEAKY